MCEPNQTICLKLDSKLSQKITQEYPTISNTKIEPNMLKSLSYNHYPKMWKKTRLLWCWAWKWSKRFMIEVFMIKTQWRGWVVNVREWNILREKWNGEKSWWGWFWEGMAFCFGLGLRRGFDWCLNITFGAASMVKKRENSVLFVEKKVGRWVKKKG